jgi:hypothetical protein
VKKIGTQCQLDSGEFLRFNRLVKPIAGMVINVTKRDFLEQLWDENDALQYLIYRHHPNLDWQDDPGRRGRENAKAIAVHLEAENARDLFTRITDNNEYCFDENHFTPEQIDAADRYIAAFIEEADQHGYGTCWGNFNVGHFGPQFVDQFERALQASVVQGNSFPCFHSYSWPTLDTSPQYLVNRYKTIMAPVRKRYPDMKCAITELGVDSGVVGEGHKGWRLAKEDLAEAADLYCGERGLAWYNSEMDDYVLFALIFGCGMYGDWASFDIADSPVIECVAALQPEPPEEEPPVSDDIRVFDMNGIEKDLAWAKAKYGVEFRRAPVSAGAKVYRLTELWEKTGHSALITNVMDESGQPMNEKDVAFYWPGAPDPPDPPTTLYPHDWHPNFVHGPTNVNGDVGPGMGRGAYHGEGEGGPHAVWVRDPDVPSDICEKLGMLAGTFHDHLDQKFQLMTAGEEPPDNGNGDTRFVAVGEPTFQPEGNNRLVIIALGDTNFYDTRASIRVKGTDIDMGPFMPDSLTKYVLTTDYTPGEGETERTFVVTIEKPDGAVISDEFEFIYETGKHGWWTLLVKWSADDGGNSNGEEPPSSGDEAAAHQLMAEGEALIAAGHEKKAQAHEILAGL